MSPTAPDQAALASSDRIAAENAHTGTPLWGSRQVRRVNETSGLVDAAPAIEGYAGVTSVQAGESIDFHVSVAGSRSYRVLVYRVGFYDGAGARLMLTSDVLAGVAQPAARHEPSTHLISCDWPVTWRLDVPADWVSGLYLAEFALADGTGRGYTPFVVRSTAAAALCVVVPFASFQAENLWPRDGVIGRSLAYGFQGRELVPATRAVKVSCDRPFHGDGLPARIDDDRHAIAWLEEHAYDVTYVTDVDLHAGRIDLTPFAGVVVSGHAEYWSTEMRAAVEAAVGTSTSVAFLSATTMLWHARLEPSASGRPDRVVVCYKTTPDPDRRPNMGTLKWRLRDPGPDRPEQALVGVQYGGVVGDPAPLVVASTEHWFWAGTGAEADDSIACLVAGEADDHDPRYPTPDGMWHSVVAQSPYTTDGGWRRTQHTAVSEAPDGTIIFAAGTSRWSHGLSDPLERDDRVRTAMTNVMARMLAPRGAAMADGAEETPAASLVEENRRTGSRLWRIGSQNTQGTDEAIPQIAGYASAASVARGASIDFHVSVPSEASFVVSVYRMGHYGGAGARHVVTSQPLAGLAQPEPSFDMASGRVECAWAPSWTLEVGDGWTSGLYVAAFTTTSGFRSLTPFVVRDDSAVAPIGVVLPFLTYQANNRWPLDRVHGKSLAFGYLPETGDNATYKTRALEVSLDRPFTKTGLPDQALIDVDVIGWLERSGHDLTYLTDADLHAGAVELNRFGGLIFVGQHEYWTPSMRTAVAQANQSAVSTAYLGAGTCHWLARVEPSADGRANRVIASYKSDPDPRAADGEATMKWRQARPGPRQPEQTLVGTQLRGKTVGSADLVVANAGHWVWAETGVTAGTIIEGLVAGQVDEVDPYAASPPGGHATLLAQSPYTLAGAQSTEVQHTNIHEFHNGAFVFSAGTEAWPLALVRQTHLDPRIQTATRNLLDRLAAGPAGLDPNRTSSTTWVRPISAADQRPTSPITIENQRPGSRAWRIGAGGTRANDDINRQITGYASATSVDVDASIDFHVSVNPAGPFTIAIYRMGHYNGVGARLMVTSDPIDGAPQADPVTHPETRAITCDWPVSWTLQVPADWTSGLYFAVFTSADGYRSLTPFVVTDPTPRDNLCIVLGFTTYQAYNQWPLDNVTGRNLYNGYQPGATNLVPTERSYVVSFDRPYHRTGQPNRMEFDLAFVRWAEEQNFDVCYATSIDLHAGRIDPTRFAGLLFPSHDEYWSRQMRDHTTAALEHGTSLGFFEGNNVYWHIRIGDAEDGRAHRMVACYKHDGDPGAGPEGVTTRWRNDRPGPRQPEQLLLGIQYNGIVARPAPLIVQEPDHWFWAGTNVQKDEAIEDVVGGEADGFDPVYGGPDGTVMLATSPYPLSGGGQAVQNTSLYETQTGAVVFASGSNDWPAALGLDGRTDRRIQQATANLLERMQAPRLAERLPQISHLTPTEPPTAERGWTTVWRSVRRRLDQIRGNA